MLNSLNNARLYILYHQEIRMKMKFTAAAALLIAATFPLPADEINLNEIVGSAVSRDESMKVLKNEAGILLLRNQLADWKHGIILNTGTDKNGLNISNIGKSGGQTITASPMAEVILPENIGTSIEAGLPITIQTTSGDPEFAASLSISQDISKLLGIEKQDHAKYAGRTAAAENLENRIILRINSIEKELLGLIKELSSLNKSIITNETSLYEKETLLENKLRSEMMLRNGSLHLSSLMEIRTLETDTARLRIDFASKLERFYNLTGTALKEAPTLPVIETPELPQHEDVLYYSVNEQRTNIALKEAELSDLKADAPPQFNLKMSGLQKVSSDSSPEFTAGLSGTFEDFSLSFDGSWNESTGGSLTAGVKLTFADKEKKALQQKISEYNLLIAKLNLDAADKTINDSINAIETAIRQIESSERNLEISEAFIGKYLAEMEDKFSRGLIPEIEIFKARDQKKLLDIDRQILNIDRYLLLNDISALIKG